MFEVFLSYSRKDEEFVRELYRRLTRDGVACFFDQVSIGWGENWVRALEHGLDDCKYIVFVLTPDFCNSEWAQVERSSLLAGRPSVWHEKVRPLLLHPCDDLPTFPRFLRHVQTINVAGAAFEANYPRICQSLDGTPGKGDVRVDRSKLPPVHPLPERHRMPFASLRDQFVGRVEAFWRLRDVLERNGTAVLQGTGGLGKTQLAIEYAHRFGAAYSGGVYWVEAYRGLGVVIEQIAEAAGIEIDAKAKEATQLEQVWRGLNRLARPCLVVFDNFPENVELRPWLPTTGRVHSLVTTRQRRPGYVFVPLGMLSEEESIRLLNSGDRKFGPELGELARRLGGYPLALELTKGFLNNRQTASVADVLAEMDKAGELEVLSGFAAEYGDQLPSGHERDVLATFQLSWELVSDAARPVLRVMGELGPSPVPVRLLRAVLKMPAAGGLSDPLGKSLDELSRLSLIELDGNADPVAHRLVLGFVRQRNELDRESPFERCLEWIQGEMDRAFENPDGGAMRELEALVPHAEHLMESARMTSDQRAELANALGWHHKNLGRYVASRATFETSLTEARKSHEDGHPDLATYQSNLATVLRDLGELAEARVLLRQALAWHEKTFSSEHPSIARDQSNLAMVLEELGELEEARDLLRLALASDEKTLAPGNPFIATRQSNLAMVLRELGELAEALDLLRLALASDEKAFAEGHPTIAIRQSNLAVVLKDLGELEEARDLLRLALASDLKTFAAGHPSTAITQSNLATVLRNLGELTEARDLLRLAVEALEKALSPNHRDTRKVRGHLEAVLKALGE